MQQEKIVTMRLAQTSWKFLTYKKELVYSTGILQYEYSVVKIPKRVVAKVKSPQWPLTFDGCFRSGFSDHVPAGSDDQVRPKSNHQCHQCSPRCRSNQLQWPECRERLSHDSGLQPEQVGHLDVYKGAGKTSTRY